MRGYKVNISLSIFTLAICFWAEGASSGKATKLLDVAVAKLDDAFVVSRFHKNPIYPLRGIIMKSLKMIVAALIVGSVSFGSMAATLLTKDELDKNPGKYEKIGTVSSTAQATDPMDLKDELSKLADEKGGQYYVVLAAREHGKFSAVADVYKDKQ
ncbi:Multiple stress resistance protein BhsA precursor [Serratia fonticola]|nr:uncharacterized protein DUF1471 [Serratia fonticola]CAI0812204.1 Multiple stress resistance protein BhsA precursor [Serratia fonticola]CAI1066895.1 Multiple stress resistance protein BhsA precursor [Serratia fonticola]